MCKRDLWGRWGGACGSRFECCTYSSEARKEKPLSDVTIELRRRPKRHPMLSASMAPLLGPSSLFEMLIAKGTVSCGARRYRDARRAINGAHLRRVMGVFLSTAASDSTPLS